MAITVASMWLLFFAKGYSLLYKRQMYDIYLTKNKAYANMITMSMANLPPAPNYKNKQEMSTMNYMYKLLAPLTMLVSLSTACGVLLHDTNIDKAFMSAWAATNTAEETGRMKPGSNPHTHVHGVSLADTLREGQSKPRTTPRNTDRKHIHQKRVARGNHTFDGYRLILENIFA